MDNCTSLTILPRDINLTSLKLMYLSNCTSLASLLEILGKMKKMWEINLSGSGISGLPFSIGI
uniref:TMV resistance protein N n=1 Tax=Cajanus cajan TaxID=3821 RepID=A0A151RMJ9_CAJCA|nr:hypothetical protein KK1_034833 [Cajanus cajan]